MNKNRAMEFLIAARSALQFPLTRNRKTAQLYIDLAITELYELQETITMLTGNDPEAIDEAQRGAVVMMSARKAIPALLKENSRLFFQTPDKSDIEKAIAVIVKTIRRNEK